jgi:hypothetical protein
VIRINITWLIERLRDQHPLLTVASEQSGLSLWLTLIAGRASIAQLITSSVYSEQVKISSGPANELVGLINPLVPDELAPKDTKITDHQAYQISSKAKELETILLSELNVMPIYLVSRKESYDIDALIDQGILLFPQSLLRKVPEALLDAQEAGRCLAFEISTGCGFHVFRVVESVLRRYWDKESGGKARPDPATLGKISADMENQKLGDQKVTEALKQLAKLHRNPLAHPDVILTTDEAIGILGMARSVITIMLNALPDIPPTTATAAAGQP